MRGSNLNVGAGLIPARLGSGLPMVRVLSPSHPDVLMAFRRRSPDDSAGGRSAPPGSRSAPPALGLSDKSKMIEKRWHAILMRVVLLSTLLLLPEIVSAEELHFDPDHEEVIYSHELKKINGEIKAAHLKILGMKLGEMTGQLVEAKLGERKAYINKGGHHALMQFCYVSDLPGDKTKVIFGVDDYDRKVASFKILSSRVIFSNSEKCMPSPLVSKSIATESDLKLGMSLKHVKNLVGTPSKEDSNRLIYFYNFKRPFTDEEIRKHRQEKSSCTDEYIYSEIVAKFLDSGLATLTVVVGGEAGDSCFHSEQGKP